MLGHTGFEEKGMAIANPFRRVKGCRRKTFHLYAYQRWNRAIPSKRKEEENKVEPD